LGFFLFSVWALILGFNFGVIFLVLAFLTTTWDELAALPLWSWMHQLDENHNKDGLISWIINFFDDLWRAIGPLLAGILYSIIGPTYTIMIGAIPLVVLTLLYYIVIKKRVMHFSFLEGEKRPHKRRSKD
jgi:predicted MFS family arabinose efflux permease